MNKKQRNRKLVTQNKRNRLVNRRYTSTIKTFSKLIAKKVKTLKEEAKNEEKVKLKTETEQLVNKVFSLLDKAVKKKAMHKNTAARRKTKLHFLAKFNIV
jgi:small subunit ribosomal protein S20